MPLQITSPEHSFIQFNGSLANTILPVFGELNTAFQFRFDPEALISLTTPVLAGIAYLNGTVLTAPFEVMNVCAQGQFEEVDFTTDFPLTVSSFPLTGYYTTPEEFLQKVSDTYGITATGQTFLQCCSLDALPTIRFTYNGGKTAGINFYKGLQWVHVTGGWDLIPVQPGQCFRFVIQVGNQTVTSNIFERVADNRYITDVTYSNNEDAYGFIYRGITVVDREEAKPPTGDQALVAGVQAPSWNLNGAKIYGPGFPLTGLGTEIAHLVTPHFWVNGEVVTERLDIMGNTTDSRMNANGIWVDNNSLPGTVWQPLNEWIGFSRKFTVQAKKTVYLGIAGDNFIRVQLNGKELLNTSGSNWNDLSTAVNYQTWSIFPIPLKEGENYIEMSVMNFNVPGLVSNPAGFACEIYDMTVGELQAARSEADLRIIFRTRDMVGQAFDVGTTIGYSCRDGWSLDKDSNGKYICVKSREADYTYNRLWLPILTKQPAYPESRKVYKKSSGIFKVLSAVIEKEWKCKTEILPDEMHDKIAVMLAHDNVHFTNPKIDSDIYKRDDYEINWPDDDTTESASAVFTVNIPFAGRNSNCEKRRACLPAIQPQPCTPIAFDTAFAFPDATAGEAYSITQQIFSGSRPITVTVFIKPDWMAVTVTPEGITYSGTPGISGAQTVQVGLANCDTFSPAFTGILTVVGAAEGMFPAYVDGTTASSGDAGYQQESVRVSGDAGATIHLTLTTLDNTNGGTLKINGQQVFEGQIITVTLDSTGFGSFIARIDGNAANTGTVIRGLFTITFASSGGIGDTANTYQISKVF